MTSTRVIDLDLEADELGELVLRFSNEDYEMLAEWIAKYRTEVSPSEVDDLVAEVSLLAKELEKASRYLEAVAKR